METGATLTQDMTADGAPAEAVEFAVKTFGRLDFLINNAGPGYPKPAVETTDEMLNRFIDGHLHAPFRFAREAFAAMTSLFAGCGLRQRPSAGHRRRLELNAFPDGRGIGALMPAWP
jgi:NAD(P)-dependent dehydrogenase (short-subunit alcohol dehydrogenase family)